MDGKLLYRYAKPCNEAEIFVFPLHSNSGKWKLVVSIRGRQTTSEDVYAETPTKKHIKKIVGKKEVVETVVLPAIWDKVLELYRFLCDKHNLKPILK